MNPLRATRLLRKNNIMKEIVAQKEKQLKINAKIRKQDKKRIKEAKMKVLNEKRMRKLNTEYKLKLGRMNRELFLNKQIQPQKHCKVYKNKSVKIRPRKQQKPKDVLFNSTNLSKLPYQIEKKNTKSTNFSSHVRSTHRTKRSSMKNSRVSWRPKNVQHSNFKVKNRQDLIDYAGKGEYFEKIVDGKLKLFRKRLVPIDDLQEIGQEYDFVYDSLMEDELNKSATQFHEPSHENMYGPIFERDLDNSPAPELFLPSGVELVKSQAQGQSENSNSNEETRYDLIKISENSPEKHTLQDSVMENLDFENQIENHQKDPLFDNIPNQDKDDPRNFLYTESQPSDADTNEFNQYTPIIPLVNISQQFFSVVSDSHFKSKRKHLREKSSIENSMKKLN